MNFSYCKNSIEWKDTRKYIVQTIQGQQDFNNESEALK